MDEQHRADIIQYRQDMKEVLAKKDEQYQEDIIQYRQDMKEMLAKKDEQHRQDMREQYAQTERLLAAGSLSSVSAPGARPLETHQVTSSTATNAAQQPHEIIPSPPSTVPA